MQQIRDSENLTRRNYYDNNYSNLFFKIYENTKSDGKIRECTGRIISKIREQEYALFAEAASAPNSRLLLRDIGGVSSCRSIQLLSEFGRRLV